jgi:hypothetical protein
VEGGQTNGEPVAELEAPGIVCEACPPYFKHGTHTCGKMKGAAFRDVASNHSMGEKAAELQFVPSEAPPRRAKVPTILKKMENGCIVLSKRGSYEVLMFLDDVAAVLAEASSEARAIEYYGLAMRILHPALHDPFSRDHLDGQRPDHKAAGSLSRGRLVRRSRILAPFHDEDPVAKGANEVSRRVPQLDGEASAIMPSNGTRSNMETGTTSGATAPVVRGIAEGVIATSTLGAVEDKLSLCSQALVRDQTSIGPDDGLTSSCCGPSSTSCTDTPATTADTDGAANGASAESSVDLPPDNNSATGASTLRQIALKTLAAPQNETLGRKRRKIVSRRWIDSDEDECSSKHGGRGHRQRRVGGNCNASSVSSAPCLSSSHSPTTMDFKVDMFVPMDISRVPCHSRSGFSLKDTLIPKRPQRFDVDVVSCVDNVGTNDFAAVGSTRTGSSVADDVEEQWPINERVCGLCGGDDASGARMVGTCWDGKSLSDEVCCDYDGQVCVIRPHVASSTACDLGSLSTLVAAAI